MKTSAPERSKAKPSANDAPLVTERMAISSAAFVSPDLGIGILRTSVEVVAVCTAGVAAAKLVLRAVGSYLYITKNPILGINVASSGVTKRHVLAVLATNLVAATPNVHSS